MSSAQPKKLASTRSFTRLESAHAHSQPASRSRSSTLSEVHLPGQDVSAEESNEGPDSKKPSLFEKPPSPDDVKPHSSTGLSQTSEFDSLPEDFDELPIELMSLADRFTSSLTNDKKYTTPPSAEELSELFQNFYTLAESHISTHIQILSSRQYRDVSPAPSQSSRSSKLTSKNSQGSLKRMDSGDGGQKMLTPEEIAERRKARRLLEHKRVALEEAMEKRVCERIYDRIWRHKKTMDEDKDEKLRSKASALAIVGIGLKDLGIDLPTFQSEEETLSQQRVLGEAISKAREGLFAMNQSHNPLGKLQGLAATHQTIVELLTQIHQSSSSADEILPTLIYTLIQSPAEEVNAISNLSFIQRFRSSSKINGEAAYCLTNLEAAITFLETVDLGSLRAEEATSGSKPSTPGASEKLEPILSSSPATMPGTASKASPVSTPVTARPIVASPITSKGPAAELKDAKSTPPPSPTHQRRLSSLLQPGTAALGAAGGVVLSTADEAFVNIKGTLDSSFNLLFGRLREQHVQRTGKNPPGPIIVPKTLDEARKMVSPKAMIDEDGTISESSSVAEQEDHAPKEDRILDMIAGTRQPRERSVDSAGSGNRKVAFASDPKLQAQVSHPLGVSPPVSAAAAVESMRNLGNSLNPLNRFSAGMNMVRGFGRTPTGTPPVASPSIPVDSGKISPLPGADARIEQPIQRFLDMADAKELKVGEVEALLKDYQRLAQALKLKGLI